MTRDEAGLLTVGDAIIGVLCCVALFGGLQSDCPPWLMAYPDFCMGLSSCSVISPAI